VSELEVSELEKIIGPFIQVWKLKEEVIGAVLMGSYAMGLSTDRSTCGTYIS